MQGIGLCHRAWVLSSRDWEAIHGGAYVPRAHPHSVKTALQLCRGMRDVAWRQEETLAADGGPPCGENQEAPSGRVYGSRIVAVASPVWGLS